MHIDFKLGVFTSLMEQIGVKDVEVEELYSLDAAEMGEDVYGLIFLFKWDSDIEKRISVQETTHMIPDNLFFAQQVIQNACATQALLSILLNADSKVEIGDMLSEFKSFTMEFTSDLKGLAIGNSDVIRNAHNSFARPESFMDESDKPKDGKGEAYHFIAYVPFQGFVYELDGLQQKPKCIGPIAPSSKWYQLVFPILQQRFELYAASEIRFNLLAIVPQKLAALKKQHDQVQASGGDVSHLAEQIEHQLRKRQEWKLENTRRKHNYVPFIVQLLKLLASKQKLEPLIKQQTNANGNP